MIPAPFFLGFNTFELVLFELAQTAINYILVIFLLRLVLRRYLANEPDVKKILFTGIYVEVCNTISTFFWYYLVLYAIAGFPLLIIFGLTLPFFAIYFSYVRNEKRNALSMKNTLVVHLTSIIPAVILSSILSSLLFNLMGIQNFFIFS